VAEVLQQHSQQLAAVESSLEALMHKAASAQVQAALQQQQADLQQQQQLDLSSALIQQHAELQAHTAQTAAQTSDFSGSIGKLQADVQQQDAALEQLATVLASVSATQQEVKSLASQQGSMQAELAHVTAYVDELACKLQTAASAAALAMQARPQHASGGSLGELPGTPGGSTGSSSSSGFSEMVAGLATLKACLDQQAGVIDDLRARLQDQDLVIQGLVEAAGQQGGDAAAAEGASESQDSDSGSAAASKAEVQDLAAQLHAVQQQLAALAAHKTATAGCSPARAATGAGAQAEIQPLADEGDEERAGGAADSEPLGFLHGMLVELKKRISKLEADSIEAKATAVTVAALQAAASSSSSSNPTTSSPAPAADLVQEASSGASADRSPAVVAPALPQGAAPAPASPAARKGAATAATGRKGAAWPGHGGQNAAADVQQLQEWLVCLQGEVSRLDAADASLSATLDSLRGDVGAAAAAAAAAAIAAKLTAAGSPAAAAQSAAPGVQAESSEASRSHVQQQGKEEHEEAADASELAQLAWFTVGELRAQVAQLSARVDAQAAAAAALDCRGSSSSDSSAVAADVAQLKQEMLSEVAAMQQAWRDDAAAAPQHEAEAAAANAQTAVSAVAALSSSVQELQDRMAEVSAQAAAAAALAASAQAASSSGAPEDRLLELQAQLEGVRAELLTLQQQVQSSAPAARLSAGSPADIRTSSTPAHTGPQAAAQGVSCTPTEEECFFTPTAVEAAAAQQDSPSEAQAEEVQRSLSFGDLAGSSSGGADGGVGVSAGAGAAAAAAAASEASLPFEADFGCASPEGTGAAQADDAAAEAAAAVVPSRQASGADSSRELSRASSTSTASGGSSSSGSSAAGKLSVRRLLEDMTSMPAAKQVAIVSKLAGLVSSHATRLLATYHEDPQLSAQLQSVQQWLAAAVHTASSPCRKQAGSPGSPAAASNTARSGSTGVAAAAGSNGSSSSSSSSSSSEALLCILDQVASLRAIGSATHPAIAEKLQRHEAQLAELREAQQGILAAINALTGADDASAAAAQVSRPLTGSVYSTPTATAVTKQPPAAALSPEGERAAEAARAAAEPEAGAQQGGSAEVSTEQQQHPSGPAAYEGELAHRLADVEGRLASGLKVLAAVRVKLSPLQEVADATQSMMRELQVCVCLFVLCVKGGSRWRGRWRALSCMHVMFNTVFALTLNVPRASPEYACNFTCSCCMLPAAFVLPAGRPRLDAAAAGVPGAPCGNRCSCHDCCRTRRGS
jgi:hypothetical protein